MWLFKVKSRQYLLFSQYILHRNYNLKFLNDNLGDLQSKSWWDKGYIEFDPTIYVLCGFRGAHNRLNLQRLWNDLNIISLKELYHSIFRLQVLSCVSLQIQESDLKKWPFNTHNTVVYFRGVRGCNHGHHGCSHSHSLLS